MKLLSLQATNFKKLNLKQPIRFPEGIVLITGLNESGKSTILDAILYGLFGRMIRPTQKPSNEEIIRYGSGESQVRLEFAVGENRYRVVREVHRTRPNRALLYEVKPNGATKPIATTVNDTTSEIERLLGGITYNEIVASSVVAQKDLERLIKQRLDDRRKVINVFLNLDSFNKVQEELDDDRSRIEGTNRNPGQITVERKQLEQLRERQEEYHAKEVQLASLAEKVKKLSAELETTQKQFADADDLRRILNEYGDAVKHRDSLERETKDKAVLINNLSQQLADLSTERAELDDAREHLDDFSSLSDIEPRLSQASRLLDVLRDDEVKLGQLKSKEEELRLEITKGENSTDSRTLPRENSQGKSVWTYLAATGALGAGAVLLFFLTYTLPAVAVGSLAVVSLVLLARQIASLSANVEVSKERQEQMAEAQMVQLRKTELAKVEQSAADLSSEISQQTKAVLRSLSEIPEYASRVELQDEPRQTVEAISAVFNQDKQSQRVYAEKVRFLTARLEREPELLQRLKDAKNELSRVEQELSSVKLPALPEGLAYSDETLLEANEYRDHLSESVSRIRTQIEESIDRQHELKEELKLGEGIDEKVEAQQRKVALLEKDLTVLKYSVKGLEQTSESLRNRVKPQVERYMGLILPVITSGRYKAVQLDDDYTVKVFDPEAGEFKPKEVFSGGTEDQVLLAMRLAFALALIPQAKGKSPEFLFLDEPLGSSDRLRRDGILALLKGELAQNFKQIFLVSHVGDLETEADTIINMDNGNVTEVVDRTRTEPKQVEESITA